MTITPASDIPSYMRRVGDVDVSSWTPANRSLLAEFSERGYVVFDLEIPDFESLAREIIEGLEPFYNSTGRLGDAWRRHRLVRELAVNRRTLDILELLYGRPAFPFQTLNFNRGTQQATHSDTIHFDSSPADYMAGVWVALEDTDAHNGPLHYFPGSHRLPRKTLADANVLRPGKQDPYKLYESIYEPMIGRFIEEQRLVAEEAHLRRGQALIWSANLLHGGCPIRDLQRSRHSQVTHYYFEGCSYLTPLLSDSERGIFRRYPVDIRTGRLVAGIENGEPLRIPLKMRAKAWTQRNLRYVTNYRR